MSQALTIANKARCTCFGVSGIRVTEREFFERKAVTAGKEMNFRMIALNVATEQNELNWYK